MQLMHMLNCLYSSSSCGVWMYSPSRSGFSYLRTMYGLTLTGLGMKSPMSTIRSRMIGKLRRGSMRIGPGAESARNGAEVSFGSPLTVIPQLPQIPILQDQRYDRV